MKTSVYIRLIALTLLLAMALPMTVFAADSGGQASDGYYYGQLTTEEARKIYDLLGQMDLKSGEVTENLVAKGVFDGSEDKDAIMADFAAARDAFLLDHDLFYVDYDAISVTKTADAILMGTGRTDNYLRTGFAADDVSGMVSAYESAVEAIAAEAMEAETLQEQVRAAYEGVMETVEYALEADAAEGNVDYVRTSYGALVKGQAVCEGYARALKDVLDAMDVESVLVQGAYMDEDDYNQNDITAEPHMWNYVRMDDNRWYLLDATMGDAGAADAYFLKGGLDDVLEAYQPNGVISLSSRSFEFNYPDL